MFKPTHLPNNALWPALCLIVYIPQSLPSLTNFAAQMQSISLNRNPGYNRDYSLRHSGHATLAAHSIVRVQQREWDTNGFISAEMYICLQNLPSLPIPAWNRAQLASILSALLPHVASISENILASEYLYLNKLIAAKEISLKKPHKTEQNPWQCIVFKHVHFFFWAKILSRLFEQWGHHSLNLFKEEIMFVNNSKCHFWFGTTSHILYL